MEGGGAGDPLRQRLEEDGYVVVPQVVPPELLEVLVADIFAHVGADEHQRASWYPDAWVSAAGMVEMYHYQSMWNHRQHPGIHAAFTRLWGTEALWVTIDRVNFKPPADPRHPKFDFKGMMHWDVDIARYPDLPFALQGVLALRDTDEGMGGFHCLPDLYRDLGPELQRRRAAGADVRRPDSARYRTVSVPARAGDLIVWSTLLPHGNGENRSDRPRLAQYISMYPARPQDQGAREQRVHLWRHNLPPGAPTFPGDARRIEEQRTQPAVLTPLGRRLLGLDAWA
jgi:hypothetical protein